MGTLGVLFGKHERNFPDPTEDVRPKCATASRIEGPPRRPKPYCRA